VQVGVDLFRKCNIDAANTSEACVLRSFRLLMFRRRAVMNLSKYCQTAQPEHNLGVAPKDKIKKSLTSWKFCVLIVKR